MRIRSGTANDKKLSQKQNIAGYAAFPTWAVELARVYHFYLHGPDGAPFSRGDGEDGAAGAAGAAGPATLAPAGEVDIICSIEKHSSDSGEPTKVAEVSLADVRDDFQSRCMVQAAKKAKKAGDASGECCADEFHFEMEAAVPGRSDGENIMKRFEGVIRYHPFMHDEETHPKEWIKYARAVIEAL